MIRIGIHHPAPLAKSAVAFANSVRERFPEVCVETIDFAAPRARVTAEFVTVILHDDVAPDAAVAAWFAKISAEEDVRPLILPLSCGSARAEPPDSLKHLKGAHWPDDSAAVLDRIGVWLGLTLLPGAQKIFISYKTSDGEAAAIALEAHLQARGYRVFRDASKDRDDGSPNIQPGDDLHDVLAKHVREASAFVLLDTPDSPKSAWIHGEVQLAMGRRIPILPVVFRTLGDPAEGSRFRRLKELHRFVPMPLAAGGPGLLPGQLAEVTQRLESFILAIAQRRRACIDGLMQEFAVRGWTLEGYGDFHHLFEAQRQQRATGQRGVRFFSCCSLEDDVRSTSVLRFIQEVTEATGKRSYARHIYFHLGDPLFGEDLDFLQREAIPAAEQRAIDFCHYQEAPLKLGVWLAAH